MKNAEAELVGKNLTEVNIKAALEKEFAAFKFRSDYRVTREYICEVTQNLVMRNLMNQRGEA